jgi:putative oxidoreductase
MINGLIDSKGVWENGLAIIRVIIGIFLIYHGAQIFATEDMKGYGQWLTDLHVPMATFMPYVGKAAELLGGVCLVLGLFTRMAAIVLALNFTFITFVMGQGKIFTENQHPFMFVLFSLIFLFVGPGRWSLDYRFFDKGK